MSKKFHPKDKLLQELVLCFESSMKNGTGEFFPEEDLEQLIEYYESLPDYEKAFVVVDRATELFPFSGSFLVKKAQLFYHAKDFDQAWETIEQARIFESSSPELLLLQADLFSAEGHFSEAVEKLQELLEAVSPKEKIDVWLEIADVYETANHAEQLGETLKNILLLKPKNEEALHRYWNFIIDNEKYEKGIEFLQLLTEKTPYNYLAWYYLAKSYEEFNLYEKAVEAYEFSIAINDYYFTHWDYAFCLQLMKEWDKAISSYGEMLDLFDKNTSIYLEIAACLRKKGDYENAIQQLILAKEHTNDKAKKANCEFQIGQVYESKEEPIQAIRHFQTALELKPNKAKFWNALAKNYMKLDRYEDAANCILQSLHKKDDQPKQWIKITECYFALKDRRNVLENMYRAHLVLPNHVKVNYQYAAYLLHYGHEQSGLQQLEYSLSLDSSKKKYIFALFPELEQNIDVMRLCEQF